MPEQIRCDQTPSCYDLNDMRTKVAAVILAMSTLAGCSRRSVQHVASEAVPSCSLPTQAEPASLAATPAINPLVSFDSAWAIIARTHWDTTYNGVNWNALRTELRPKAEQARTLGELRMVLADMVSRLKQSHFSIIPQEYSDNRAPSDNRAASDDRSASIGVTLRFLDNELVITHVEANGPAANAGIRPGYVLHAIDGCAISPRLSRIPRNRDARAVALEAYSIGNRALAGPSGDTVSATFLNEKGTPINATLVRQPEPGTLVKFGNLPPRVANLEWERKSIKGKTIGVIRWNIWMPILGARFDNAIDSLRNSDAIILDVRGNPGGVGGMSMGFSGHFLDSVKVIGVMKQRGTDDLRFVSNPRLVNGANQRVSPFSGPLAIVVDEISVSTTEIFAEGMQEMGRARVFGSQTAGQALPSVAERLPNGDILYHAIANFVSPSGKAIEGPGVTPDVRIKLSKKALLKNQDPALDAALKWAASQKRSGK